MQNCCSLYKGSVSGVGGIKLQSVWGTLRPGPECLARSGGGVLGEIVQQLCDAVVVALLKLLASPDNAVVESQGLLGDQEVA